VFYPLLGIACGLMSVLFVRVYFGVELWARRAPLKGAWLALAGGAIAGGMVHLSRGLLLSTGHLAIPLDQFWHETWLILVLLAVGKVVATAITLQTGGSGGLFTPSLYVGAATGSAFGVLLTGLFPGLHLSPEPYALVGMGAVIAAATNAPMTGILMVFEMTNDSAIMIPLMLAVVVSHALARRLERDSLYSGWLRRRGEHFDHGEDRDVLAALRVEDAFDRTPTTIPAVDVASRFLLHLGAGTQDVFPVVEADRRLLGVVTVPDLARISREDRDRQQELTAQVVARPTETVTPGDSLLEAMRRMDARGVAALPVVEAHDGTLVGLLSRSDVLAVYGRILAGVPEGPPAVNAAGSR
jgi:CIC family chloride channel protein